MFVLKVVGQCEITIEIKTDILSKLHQSFSFLGLVNKKKGVKSTLGRIFGKKDKGHHQMKALAASAAAGGVKSPAGVSLGSPQVFSYHIIFMYHLQIISSV